MMHLFKPAMKLFNRFNLFAKFLLFSSFLIVLLVLSASQYLTSVNSYITFNAKEVVGTGFAMESKNLMENVLIYRDNVTNQASGQEEIANKIEANLVKLRSLNKENQNVLDNTTSKADVSADVENCADLWKTVSKMSSDENFDNLLVAINTLHTDISDNSNLTLDPDLDSYYCMDVVMFRSLAVLKNLYDQKSLIESMDLSNIDAADQKSITRLNTQLITLSDTISGDMKTALSFNNGKEVKTLDVLTENIDQLDKAMESLTSEIDEIGTDTDKNQLVADINQAIELNSAIFDSVDQKLEKLITLRVDAYEENRTTFIIILIIAAPILIYVYLAFVFSITESIRKINVGLKRIAENNLQENIKVESKDELGTVSVGFNYMVENLKNTLHAITETSTHVGDAVDKVNEGIVHFDHKIQAISGTIENLSGSTEELSASAEEIRATAGNLNESATGMQEKARECFVVAENIYTRTGNTIENIKNSKTNTENMLRVTEMELEKSLEAVKAVDQINLLSEAIMKITHQTNMLALNASIEAVRAGEAGKGFTVVADEVKKLAEQSNQTALQIQNVVETIAVSVGELTTNSKNFMQFVRTNVIAEYGNVIAYGNDFADDAQTFKEFARTVSGLSDTLSQSVQTLASTISEMAKANSYSAAEIQQITTNVLEMKQDSALLVNEVQNVSDNMENLEGESKKFVL